MQHIDLRHQESPQSFRKPPPQRLSKQMRTDDKERQKPLRVIRPPRPKNKQHETPRDLGIPPNARSCQHRLEQFRISSWPSLSVPYRPMRKKPPPNHNPIMQREKRCKSHHPQHSRGPQTNRPTRLENVQNHHRNSEHMHVKSKDARGWEARLAAYSPGDAFEEGVPVYEAV